MKEFFLLLLCHDASPVTHSLIFFITASSGVPNFPEFVIVGMVDELQVLYYDNNIQELVYKQDWMNQLIADKPQYLERGIGIAMRNQQVYKVRIDILKQRFNQTGDVHIYQLISGCKWDDETGEIFGYKQYGYDGEDFISFDLKTLTWIAPKQQAFITKQRWERNRALTERQKHFHNKECIDWLKRCLSYGKSVLQRTERPSVSLLQKSPSSPVSCHATGFYPDSIMVMWRKDGEELQDYGELLPNHDGTFQKAVDIHLAGVQPGDWGNYECVVQQRGVYDIITRLDQSVVRTNWGRKTPEFPTHYVVGGVIGGLVLVVLCIAVVVWRNRQNGGPI